MGHHCVYTCEFYIDVENQVCFELTAHWNNKSQTVYKECEDGNCWYRYIYYSSFGGYCVTFVGEKLNYYYGFSNIQQEEDYAECKRINLSNIVWEKQDLKGIELERPDLHYLFKKYKGRNPYDLIDLIKAYRNNQSIESLVDGGLISLAKDKRLNKLDKNKKLAVINFIKKEELMGSKNSGYINLSRILFCIKHKLTYEESEKYSEYRFSYDLGNYLMKQQETLYFYHDYIKLAKLCNKNVNDKYWKFPSDLRAKHNELVIIRENMMREEEAKRNEQARIEFENIKIGIAFVGTQFEAKEIDGYKVYVPETYEDISKQADDLNQCLISMDYYSKMAKANCILIFIRKDDQPLATAEIDFSKKLRQFYADEIDRDNCTPSEELKSVLEKYLQSMEIKRDQLWMKEQIEQRKICMNIRA